VVLENVIGGEKRKESATSVSKFSRGFTMALVHAALQLRRGHADQALRTLEPVKPYELGFHACLLPMHVRATAYLQLRSGRKAAAEFQGVLDHRGVRPLASRRELSQLGLARAYAMQGDMTGAPCSVPGLLYPLEGCRS
jgi:eukaryotic-like serine/threonine-protein kinase